MVFRNVQELPKHVADHHDIPVPNSSQLKFSTGQQAARFFFQTHRLNFQNQLDLSSLMGVYKVDIHGFIQKNLSELEPIKLQFSAFANLVKPIEETNI